MGNEGDEVEKGRKALERQQRIYDRQNRYLRKNFRKITITIPKEWSTLLERTGESINGFTKRLMREEFIKRGWMDDSGHVK